MMSGKLQKGFVFTSDAVMGLAIVILITSLIAVNYTAVEKSTDSFKSIESKTSDNAVVGFYKNISSSQSLDSGAKFAKCNSSFNLIPSATADQALPVKKTFCEKI